MKKVRITLSLILFSLITFYFLDFADLLPHKFHAVMQWQMVPAILAMNLVVLTLIVVVTLLFGRVYCSSLCPMGIFQDIADWIAKRFNRKKKYPHFKEYRILRWSIVAIVLVAFLCGFHILLNLLDPYSAYGRI